MPYLRKPEEGQDENDVGPRHFEAELIEALTLVILGHLLIGVRRMNKNGPPSFTLYMYMYPL